MEDFMDKGVFILMATICFILTTLSAWMSLHYIVEGCAIGCVGWIVISALWVVPATLCIKIAAMS